MWKTKENVSPLLALSSLPLLPFSFPVEK